MVRFARMASSRGWWSIAVVCGLGGTALAALALTTASDLLSSAKTVVVVRIEKIESGRITGKVSTAIRGPKLGESVTFDVAPLPADTKEALVICPGPDLCTAALDRGGFFVTEAWGGR